MALCYRDRTYCASNCTNHHCIRFVSPEIEAAAKKFGLPLALSNYSATCESYTRPAPRPTTPAPNSVTL